MPGQMPGVQDMYGRPPSALSMNQRSQYPYGPAYDRRWAHTVYCSLVISLFTHMSPKKTLLLSDPQTRPRDGDGGEHGSTWEPEQFGAFKQ